MADDVLQEVFLAFCQKFFQMKNKDSFKAWIISIARNKCNDYFRKMAVRLEVPIDALTEKEFTAGRHGIAEVCTVRETFDLLSDKDKRILYPYFRKELSQAEIAKRLNCLGGEQAVLNGYSTYLLGTLTICRAYTIIKVPNERGGVNYDRERNLPRLWASL